jgi:hypothetical protein
VPEHILYALHEQASPLFLFTVYFHSLKWLVLVSDSCGFRECYLISILVVFYGLNVVRLLSIIALLLVFSSSILVMVTNIKAVNAFQNAKIHGTSASGNDTDANIDELMLDCDYIMCVPPLCDCRHLSNQLQG